MDQSAITTEKARLRALAAARRDQLRSRDEASATIAARVLGLPEFRAAAAIHCFLPIRSEVDTCPIIAAALAAGKRVAIPITVSGGPLEHSWITSLDPALFERGVFGTPRPKVIEPARPGEWGLTIVPLLAFDRSCTRLGYGKGHYDRLLAQAGGATVGVAFAGQEQPVLPRAPHDFPLDLIATEHELIHRP
jgi:5-formyltetrahydrofolate cyclo-ligase